MFVLLPFPIYKTILVHIFNSIKFKQYKISALLANFITYYYSMCIHIASHSHPLPFYTITSMYKKACSHYVSRLTTSVHVLKLSVVHMHIYLFIYLFCMKWISPCRFCNFASTYFSTLVHLLHWYALKKHLSRQIFITFVTCTESSIILLWVIF